LLKARALNVSSYVSLRPGILASGPAAARLDGLPRTKGPTLAMHAGRTASIARAGPKPRRYSGGIRCLYYRRSWRKDGEDISC
jgi:hypothetical protein